MKKTPETIEIIVEKLFAVCRFDPRYMDETWCKAQFRRALADMLDDEWDYIVAKCQEAEDD